MGFAGLGRWSAMAVLLAALLGHAPRAQAQSAASAAEWSDVVGAETETRANLVYRVAGGQELKLDLYLPLARQQRGPVPLAVYFHGGGWVSGGKEVATLRLLPYLQMGWAAATVQYRLHGSAPAPAAVEDVRCALRWLSYRAPELKTDPQRLVISGGSAGGHLALLAGMLPAGTPFDRACPTEGGDRWRNGREPALKVAAIVNWFGISDLNALLQGPDAKHYAIEWFGAMPEAERERLARELSPLTHARAGGPPVITIHGEADDVVPFSQARRLHAALEQAGVVNRLIAIPGGGHGGFGRAATARAAAAVREFLQAQGLVPMD